MTPLVSIHNVHVTLGGAEILRGVSAAIDRGRITALMGLNGSGKTTLLRCILHEIPYRGLIEFHCGHDHRQPNPQHVGYVPQKLHIDAHLPLTVRDLLGLALQRRPLFLGIRAGLKAQMERMLEGVGAPGSLLERPVEKLSGGELQRVLLALALEPSPELLLLDEPASGVDFQDRERLYDFISRLNREKGTTVVLVSHDISVVGQHTHHVLCLKDGKIRCEGPPREIITTDMLGQIFGAQSEFYTHPHEHHDHD